MSKQQPSEPLLTVKQCAALFNVDAQFFLRHRELPGRFKVGRHVRFSERALREYFSRKSFE